MDPLKETLERIASRRPAVPVAPAIQAAAVRLRGGDEAAADAWISEITASVTDSQGSPSRHVTSTVVAALLERLDALERGS